MYRTPCTGHRRERRNLEVGGAKAVSSRLEGRGLDGLLIGLHRGSFLTNGPGPSRLVLLLLDHPVECGLGPVPWAVLILTPGLAMLNPANRLGGKSSVSGCRNVHRGEDIQTSTLTNMLSSKKLFRFTEDTMTNTSGDRSVYWDHLPSCEIIPGMSVII